MSQALRAAIAKKLMGSDALAALVDVDPQDADFPAIYAGRKRFAPPIYPCLTYRVEVDVPDKRFRGPVGNTAGRIINTAIDFEYWTKSEDTLPIEQVMATLDALLDNQAFDVAAASGDAGGRVIQCVRTMGETDLWDKDLECSFSLFRFHIRYAPS